MSHGHNLKASQLRTTATAPYLLFQPKSFALSLVFNGGGACMDVQLSRVRKLVEPDPARPRYIQTVWGYGYVFVPDGQPRSR